MFKIKVPTGLVFFEASLFALYMATLTLPLHFFPLCVRLCVLISFPYKDTNQIGLEPTLMSSF